MNLVYNASAGTGKTYRITQLYEKLVLEDGIDPRNILLMTFTRNAAAELRTRVAHRLLKARRLAESDNDDALADRAIAAMSHLPSAPISTIDAFCTRLLREHALEVGLSPGFSVLEEDDRKELLDQICRDELLVRLGSDPDFKAFCSGAHIIGNGKGFGTSITETVPRLIGQAGSLGISLGNAEAMLPKPAPNTTRIDFEMICKRIRELPRITPAVQTALDILEQSLKETDDVESLAMRMGELGIKKFGRGAKEISDDFWQLKESVEDAIRYREYYPAAKAFARYVQSVHLKFQQRKHAMDAVDFAGLSHMAVELLKSGKAAPGLEYVLVDEVQDISRIQYQLIQSLWGEETNLVICGDRKQGIYTWRDADPQVMPDLEKEILATDGALATVSHVPRQRGHVKNLQTSYRSKTPIIDVVNKLFATVYGEEEYSATETLKANDAFKTEDEKPCIEFLSFDGEEECPKQDKIAAEMEAVANRIQLLAGGAAGWSPSYRYSDGFEPTGKGNNYCYSDILILLRRTTHQSALEHALRHADIPYTLGGKGRGLFARQETRDVSLFLNVVTNPKDAYSLVGFLRSPWVGLSDEAIAELAWSDEGFSTENLLANYARETDVIDRYRKLLGTKLASELVRMLIDETGYDALLAGLPRGTQRLANLRKVLDWLRENERGAQTTPAAVTRKLAEQIKNPPKVPEAALLDPAQNAVTIMTVHGAKGLTKRVVFLPDISFRPDSDKGFVCLFFDEQKIPSLGVKITAPDKSAVKSPGFKAANDRAKTVRNHELKNLFYVAMTRARDLVVTSATVGQNPSGWLKQMEPLIGNDIPAIPYSALSVAVDPTPTPNLERPTTNNLTTAMQILPPPPAPPTLHRIPATRLAKEHALSSRHPLAPSSDNATALGSFGHAVLEQLALNDWNGSVGDWLERLCDGFGIGNAEAATLEGRIETTRELMIETTAGMQEIHPEFPFVLHDGDRLIDGTIDLLCRSDDSFVIFDYKFTEASDAAVIDTYRGQMEIYGEATRKAFPNAGNPDISLVVVSAKGPRLVSMPI